MTAAVGRESGHPGGGAWRHQHLLDTAELTRDDLDLVLRTTDAMGTVLADPVGRGAALQGVGVTILFYEASTRTRVSFELAARRLSAETVNVAVAASSATKGESLADTVRTVRALGARILVLRHSRSGAPYLAARHFDGHVVNAGDGWHAHPTQALVDLYTLRQRLGPDLAGAKVAIVGDVLHSRVARSNVWALTTLGVEVWLCGPVALVAGFQAWADAMPRGRIVRVTSDLAEALRGADAVMALRVQHERDAGARLRHAGDYADRYQITGERLLAARDGAPLLHPGPVNEGVEIEGELAQTWPTSAVTEQVRNGVAVRMAVLRLVASTSELAR